MNYFFSELNKDQLNGLATLCFDLAKGMFALVFFPASQITEFPLLAFLKILLALFMGLAFTYIALILLKVKEGVKE